MIRAVTVAPRVAGSARLETLDEPPGNGDVLVEGLLLGICGTDHEVLAGHHGAPPPDRERMVLGHESLGRVLEAPAGSGFGTGDLVAGIVRRPDPVPCANCAVGEWDMCRNGRFTERGIVARDGYGAQRWRVDPSFAVPVPSDLGDVGVLVEPTSVVAKAWEHTERIGARARWVAERVLIIGAGPIGLLAALLASQRDLEVHVLDRVEEGPKPDLVRDLGATYHTSSVAEACDGADVVIECTGVAALAFEAMGSTGRNGIVCLTGVSSGGRSMEVPAGRITRELVLENDVVFGSVNANRRHYDQAVAALAAADRSWLERLLTRRVPLDRWNEAFERREHDVKVVLDLA